MRTNNIFITQLDRLFRGIETAALRDDFQIKIRELFNFLNRYPFFKTLSYRLDSFDDPAYSEIEKASSKEYKGTQMSVRDEKYRGVAAYFSLKKIEQSGLPGSLDIHYLKSNYLNAFRLMIENSFIQSEDIRLVLMRYIKRITLYDAERILDKLSEFREKNPRNARVEEKFLAPMINRYLFDNGIEIVSEPKVQNRRVDVLGLMPEKEGFSDFLLEYKVLLKSLSSPEKYIKEAFFQAYSYAKQYQKNIVYLIIFIIGEGDVNLELPQMSLLEDFSTHYFDFDNVRVIALKVFLKPSNMKGEINEEKLSSFFLNAQSS